MSKVHFIGAGPGDPELITVKGQRLIGEADLVLYAGSLVPQACVDKAKPGAKVVDSAPLNLEQTHALLRDCVRGGGAAARVHTGDPSLYGAVQEQIRLLERDGIGWEIVPGVTSAMAGAAAAGKSFTVPGGTQTLLFTRLEGRTPVPERERLRELARHGTAMAIYLSAGDPEGVQAELLLGDVPEDTPLCVVYRVGWPEQEIVETTVGALAKTARKHDFTRQTLFLVLPGGGGESLLYDKNFSHMFRGD